MDGGLEWGEGEDYGQFFKHFRSFWEKAAILMPAFWSHFVDF